MLLCLCRNEPNCWSNPNYTSDPQHAGCTYILPRVYAKLVAEVYVQNADLIQSRGLELVSGGLFAHDIGGSFSWAGDYMTQVYDMGPWYDDVRNAMRPFNLNCAQFLTVLSVFSARGHVACCACVGTGSRRIIPLVIHGQ